MNNLYGIIKRIQEASISNKLVAEFGNGDIYEIMNSGVHKYPAVILTIQNSSEVNEYTNSVDLTLFYVDRLLDNNANKVQIQSMANTVLSQIMNKLSEDNPEYVFGTKTFTYFDEKLADLVSGAYVQTTLQYPQDLMCSDSQFEVKTITLTENGIYDVIGYDTAIVNVIPLWGTIEGNIEEQTDLIEYIRTNTDKVEAGENVWIETSGNTKVINAVDTIYDDTEVRELISGNTQAINQEIQDRKEADAELQGEIDDLKDFTCDTIVPTTTNFVPGVQYSHNEAFQRIADLFAGQQGEINDINALIPNQATTENQLADKDFVNSTVATNAANFRGNWGTWADVPTDANSYPADYVGNKKPTNNDYMTLMEASGYTGTGDEIIVTRVQNVEDKPAWKIVYKDNEFLYNEIDSIVEYNVNGTRVAVYAHTTNNTFWLKSTTNLLKFKDREYTKNSWINIQPITTSQPGDTFIVFFLDETPVTYSGQWRFMYTGDWDVLGKSGWKPQYKIGAPFTAAQQAALDSTITSEKVSQYDSYNGRITAVETDKLDKVYSSGKKVYGTTQNGGQTMYTAGTNIQFNDNGTISATDTKYTAGTGININSTKVISAVKNSWIWEDENDNNVVLGNGYNDGGNSTVMIGDDTSNEGDNNVIIGEGAYVLPGEDNTIIGIGAFTEQGCRNVVVGENSYIVDSNNSVAIGKEAVVDGADNAIQLGNGENTEPGTLQVGNYQLLDAYGYIPPERLKGVEIKKKPIAVHRAIPVRQLNKESEGEDSIFGGRAGNRYFIGMGDAAIVTFKKIIEEDLRTLNQSGLNFAMVGNYIKYGINVYDIQINVRELDLSSNHPYIFEAIEGGSLSDFLSNPTEYLHPCPGLTCDTNTQDFKIDKGVVICTKPTRLCIARLGEWDSPNLHSNTNRFLPVCIMPEGADKDNSNVNPFVNLYRNQEVLCLDTYYFGNNEDSYTYHNLPNRFIKTEIGNTVYEKTKRRLDRRKLRFIAPYAVYYKHHPSDTLRGKWQKSLSDTLGNNIYSGHPVRIYAVSRRRYKSINHFDFISIARLEHIKQGKRSYYMFEDYKFIREI